MIQTDEQVQEIVDQFLDVFKGRKSLDIETVRGALKSMAINVRDGMKEELNIELGQCECGQEHDIRFMVTDSEGNHICFECYCAWVSEFSKHVRKLLRMRAAVSVTKVPDESLRYIAVIDQLGEDYTNVGKGWEEHVNEDWDEEYTSPEKREMAKLIPEAELEIAQARAEKFETLTKALLNVVASKDGRVLSAISTPDFQKKVKALHELIYG